MLGSCDCKADWVRTNAWVNTSRIRSSCKLETSKGQACDKQRIMSLHLCFHNYTFRHFADEIHQRRFRHALPLVQNFSVSGCRALWCCANRCQPCAIQEFLKIGGPQDPRDTWRSWGIVIASRDDFENIP